MNSQLKRERSWHLLLEDLATLQNEWERKGARLGQQGQAVWLSGVLFGIETGRQRIAWYRSRPPMELNALLDEWDRIGREEKTGNVNAFTRGMDFGIQLVIGRVRPYLKRPALLKSLSSNPTKGHPRK